MKALLALEDGRVFWGYAFGALGEVSGEVVFNTSMTGYQEILTDPSYKGQIVTMTYPLIGNYGVNSEDVESAKPQVEGFIVREKSSLYSNWRAEEGLEEYLKRHGIMGLERIDTRALTRHIRERGAMRGVMSCLDLDPVSLVEKARSIPEMAGQDLVQKVTTQKPYVWSEDGTYTIAVLDCGVKFGILRQLAKRCCRVIVYPAFTQAEDVLREKPDGILLSNGPGDPAALPYVVEFARRVIGKVPVFGICLGHQVIAQALGAKTFKLKFGHHGGNHPVKDLRTGQVAITTQNHGFSVDADTLPGNVEVTHVNLNDFTLEGIAHRELPLFSVQFHPEACPGPHDTAYLFDRFIRMVEDCRA
ncbi:glutamine-hydrolyzing carbamoyl-phosphate synthase small subunit [Candidatus Caldatribacterium sp. SIUC1]|uniref:glutamine-hydrolyzing carbamoyl-phosphate synthase small subunit n=1 Tax=Candidatus Caldatribacterium sp. SIUC1 TaxID=3418365 RepID=UPI003F692237